MTSRQFVKKRLANHFIEPALPTPAIEAMASGFRTLFPQSHPCRKQEIITCFDASGSGKTMTVLEACKSINGVLAALSPVFTEPLQLSLESCANVWRRLGYAHTDLVKRLILKDEFVAKFYSALASIFGLIESQLAMTGDVCFVVRVGSASSLHQGPSKGLASAYQGMLEAL